MSLLPAPAPAFVDDLLLDTAQHGSTTTVLSHDAGSDEIDLLPATALGIMLFAKLMTSVGSVQTLGVRDASLNGTRIVTHVPDADGYTVAFLSIIDGLPEVHDFNFDLGETAHRHLLHSDGRGLTLCDYRNLPHVHYRLPDSIPTAAAAATAIAATGLAIPAPRKGD